jgi:hypothetical protein
VVPSGGDQLFLAAGFARRHREEAPVIVLSVSGVLLLSAIALFLCRKDGLKVWHAVVCALLGFYLAFTSIAPSIRQGTASAASLISAIRF